jgi:hypothetical protein
MSDSWKAMSPNSSMAPSDQPRACRNSRVE